MRTTEEIIAELLENLGVPPERMSETPRRYAKALREMTAGYRGDVHDILATRFDVEARRDALGAPGTSIVATRPIRFTALCEHHALPFMGIAKIAYVPNVDADGRRTVIGLSKFIRLVRLYAERFTMQERIGEQIAYALLDVAGADGAMVITRARHTCLCARGVRDGECETTAFFSVGALDVGRPLHVTATKILDPSPRVPL